jgi:hypothetical protein
MSFNYGLRPEVLHNVTMTGSGTTASVQLLAAFGSQTEYVRLVGAC